jgi:class 3 adenylate cyclase
LLNSKEILEQTGISRATLNNYIGWGIVPKPEVLPPEPQDGGAPRLGYFPDEVVGRIAEIQRLKKDGWSMPRIAEHFGAPVPTSPPAEDDSAADSPAEPRAGAAAPARGGAVVQPSQARPQAKPSPVLTDVAVLVAGLQHSATLWAELPAEDYFALINQVWSTVDPIFKHHSASHGKHPSDGMVGYFFLEPGSNYLWNALLAAHEIRDAMRRVSKDWQLRKGWSTDLYMNIGIDEGQEWLGTFRSASTVEFAAFAETINQAALISDFSRFGAVWATKNLVGKLPPEQRQRLRYGVRRKNNDGQHVFMPSIFSDVQRIAHTAAGTDQRRELPLLPVTEIIEIPVDRGL